jgi:hypothetical protein
MWPHRRSQPSTTTDAFDLRLFDMALFSAETPPSGDPVVEWPAEFFEVWLVRPN